MECRRGNFGTVKEVPEGYGGFGENGRYFLIRFDKEKPAGGFTIPEERGYDGQFLFVDELYLEAV